MGAENKTENAGSSPQPQDTTRGNPMTTATLSAAPSTERELLARKRGAAPEVSGRCETRAVAPTRSARVVIEYCPLSNYGPVAEALAAAIGEEFEGASVETERVAVRGGGYEVSINGRLVFSKRATYRLPDPDEIFYHVRVALGQGPSRGPMVPPSG